MTKYPPVDDAHWPQSLDDLKGGFATRLNVYRTMAHHPALLSAWAPLRDHVVVQTALGRQFSEVVILRTGHHMGSAYEWAHHVSRGRAVGLSDARIAAIAGPIESMEPADAALAAAVDALIENKRLGDQTREAVLALVGTAGLFDLMATVGFYMTLGFIVNSFDTPLDADVAAELADGPLGARP
jgi:4-carboxymuconolactone decarboxylase